MENHVGNLHADYRIFLISKRLFIMLSDAVVLLAFAHGPVLVFSSPGAQKRGEIQK